MQEHFAPLPPLDPKSGVLVVDGYGVSLSVRKGRLQVSDGIGRDRRAAEFARATCGIRRVVILGGAGYMSLEAVRWLTDVGASLVHIDRDGRLLMASMVVGNDDSRLRRAQALARGTPIGSGIARDLLQAKLVGQARNLERLGAGPEARADASSALALLDSAESPQELMVPESAAAITYWNTWSNIEVSFVRADLPRVPDHWRRFGKRASPLTGNPRLAANPPNAILNYLYALVEAECRIACLTIGLDPGLGVLHADQRNRDSMALDVMEAVRPQVDAILLDLLEGHVFRAQDFHETRQGVCRVLAPLTHRLAQTTPRIRPLVGSVVERVAKSLLQRPGRRDTIPTLITHDHRSRGRDGIRHGAAKASRHRARPLQPACRTCGLLVDDAGRTHCDACLPKVKRDSWQAASGAGHAKLAELRRAGVDPAHSRDALEKASSSQRARNREAREYEIQAGQLPDRDVFVREILPDLQGLSLRAMAKATGLSSGYCSMVRRGLCVPHPRHWEALRSVIGSNYTREVR